MEYLDADARILKLYVKETGFDESECLNLGQDLDKRRGVVTRVTSLRVPQNGEECFH